MHSQAGGSSCLLKMHLMRGGSKYRDVVMVCCTTRLYIHTFQSSQIQFPKMAVECTACTAALLFIVLLLVTPRLLLHLRWWRAVTLTNVGHYHPHHSPLTHFIIDCLMQTDPGRYLGPDSQLFWA